MGSATESNAKPQISMADNDKKTFKKLLKVFFKKDKKKDKAAEVNEAAEKRNEVAEVIEKDNQTSIAAKAIEKVLQNIEKLNIKDENEYNNFSYKTVDTKEKVDNEFDNFTIKTVKDEGRNDRSDSHSSEDSGFADKFEQPSDAEEDTEKNDEVIEALEKLTIDKEEDGKGKDKRVQTVVVARTPIRQKANYKSAPYFVQQTDPCRQIQVNKHTLTGGQVIVNRTNDFLEVDAALKQVQQTSQHSQHENQDEWFSIITEVIQEDSAEKTIEEKETDTVEDFLSDFFQTQEVQQDFYQPQIEDTPPSLTPPRQDNLENPIEQFSNYEFLGEVDFVTSLNAFVDNSCRAQDGFMFPTPPHSENAASPMSDSQGSYRTSEYTYSPGTPGRSVILSSPERSSPICNENYEKFQEISHFEESPISLDEERKKERTNSTSSMTMKQYKDLQKEISHTFSKKECCQMTRKPCREYFQEYMKKLPSEERKSICLKVAKMDLTHAYGVLQNILKSLSQSSSQEDIQHAVFCLVCERVLTQTPAWYVNDFGLNLLKSAALRCPNRPLLTRYLVQCVRIAIRSDPACIQGRDSVFHEVDAQGDTLLTALARGGDACADVLAELVRDQPPLFKLHHLNADGASALHVACSEHSSSEPKLHIVHVLLEHGAADLWQGDAKAGDTPVHMAVNSKNCDLHLVMVMFKHVDRKVWKKLAHAPNMCSTTPLEYARSATKSQVRNGYPSEVLEFLKKCR